MSKKKEGTLESLFKDVQALNPTDVVVLAMHDGGKITIKTSSLGGEMKIGKSAHLCQALNAYVNSLFNFNKNG